MTFFTKLSNIASYFSFKNTENQKVTARIFEYRVKKLAVNMIEML